MRGTILLNEIGELPQASSKSSCSPSSTHWSFTRAGGERVLRSNFLIAATNKDLQNVVFCRQVSEGFVLYRLNVFEVKVPPPRDRRDDIPILMQEIIADLASRTPRHQHGPVDADCYGQTDQLRLARKRQGAPERSGEKL